MTDTSRETALLCCRLGRRCRPFTLQQYRTLRARAGVSGPEAVTLEGLSPLLSGDSLARARELLRGGDILQRWQDRGIALCSIWDDDYPTLLKQRLGDDAPPALFLLGNRSLLGADAVSLVGSRELREENAAFAAEIGTYAAEAGKSLCSGDARGADRTAQEACLRAGGTVVSFVADALLARTQGENVLYLSEDGAEYGFSAFRALQRNRLIHAFGTCTFVAQATDGKGGSWSGTLKNLQNRWTPVYVFCDGSAAAAHLIREGARPYTGRAAIPMNRT